MNTIVFTNVGGVPEKHAPTPATTHIPEWYKNLDTYIGGDKKPRGDGTTSATIKKCMPVFDALTSGYIIYTPVDVYVSQVENAEGTPTPYYEWPSFGPIEFHPLEQAPTHPNNTGHIEYPKWINPWGIKTPKGYSILIVQPMHRDSVFTILPGVVDTDTYDAPINFPFVLNDINFTGLIPAGTPMAQVIPFKRDEWGIKFGEEKELNSQARTRNLLRTKFFDGYKSLFRSIKTYK